MEMKIPIIGLENPYCRVGIFQPFWTNRLMEDWGVRHHDADIRQFFIISCSRS